MQKKHVVTADWMPFLSPNLQHQITETVLVPPKVKNLQATISIDVKNVFLRFFYSGHVFFTFLTFFIFANVFHF